MMAGAGTDEGRKAQARGIKFGRPKLFHFQIAEALARRAANP